MIKRRKSQNYTIFRNLRSKLRHSDYSKETAYLLVFTFLYKYCSDSLKDYFLSVVEDKEMTLDEAFEDSYCQEIFKNDAFHMFGYYINKPEAYIDEVINTEYTGRFFLSKFFRAFRQNIEFVPNSNHEKYFNFMFELFDEEVNLKKLEFDSELNLIYKDLIFSISKLEIYEEEFSFTEVFNQICQVRSFGIDHDPDYINSILAELVYASKSSPMDIYNPFLNDASSLVNLADKFPVTFGKAYGKNYDKITYCVSIVKLFLNYFNLESVFLEFGNAIESVDIDGSSYDVIMSKLPQIGGWSSRLMNKTQNMEFSKRNKRRKLENVLSTNFKMNGNAFADDSQLNDALENLLEKLEMDMGSEIEFSGEYSSLKDSEYLFLINLINCLKTDGVMVVAIPQSFLFKNSLFSLRKYLTYEHNYIDTIISIPDELGRSTRPEIICIFKKNRTHDDVLFIDLSQGFETKKDPNALPGMFKRNLLLSNESIGKLIKVYTNKQIIDKYSNVVTVSDIAKNDFNLSVSRYVDTFEGEFIQLKDLVHEKEEITSNIKKLNKKIDDMMDELGLKF